MDHRNAILQFLHISVILALFATLNACSLLPEQQDQTKNWSAAQLYERAKAALDSGDYETAVKHFETLEARYPFGRYAQQAMLDMGYAYYKGEEPDAAIATMDRFIKVHPRHPHVDYAYYLKGLVNFTRGENIIDRVLPRDPADRDPGFARQAFYDFSEVVTRFPNSKYAKDAGQRMLFLRNNVALHEVHVADYYMRRKAYVAASNRAKYVIENYQGTTAVPQALEVLVHAYTAMGLTDLKNDTLRVIEMNYPQRAVTQTGSDNPDE